MAVCPEERLRIQAFRQLVEGLVDDIFFSLCRNRLDDTVGNVEIGDGVDRQRQQFVSFDRYQKMCLVILCPLEILHQFQKIRLCRADGMQPFQFGKGGLHFLLVDGFQQVVDAVHFESPKGVFVIGSSEDDGAGDIRMLEYLEGRAVCQMDIHENQFGHGVATEPVDGIGYAVQYIDKFHVRCQLFQHRFQVTCGCFLVFDNQVFHTVMRCLEVSPAEC